MRTSSTIVRTVPRGRGSRLVALGAASLAFLPVLASAQTPVPPVGLEPVAQTRAVGVIPSVRFAEPEAAAPRYRFTFTPGELAAMQQASDGQADGRACTGCPKRRPVVATLQVLGINVLYNVMNRVIKAPEEKHYFRVSFGSWWDNLQYGFEWDDNAFAVNQIGHPYQGANYFTAGRSNGLSFWESAPLAALGSATWELPRRDPQALRERPHQYHGGRHRDR